MPSEKEIVAEYRAAHPLSRARSILVLSKNTSATKQYRCILCDAESPTCSAKYPLTKRVREWCVAHVASHTTLPPQQTQVVQPDAYPVVDVPRPLPRVGQD